MFGDYWYGDASKKTIPEKATTKAIAMMESKWLGDLRRLLTGDPMLLYEIEEVGDRCQEHILMLPLWDGKRRCCECGLPVDKWFRGRMCRKCWFDNN